VSCGLDIVPSLSCLNQIIRLSEAVAILLWTNSRAGVGRRLSFRDLTYTSRCAAAAAESINANPSQRNLLDSEETANQRNHESRSSVVWWRRKFCETRERLPKSGAAFRTGHDGQKA
jgi:hypothetical protein